MSYWYVFAAHVNLHEFSAQSVDMCKVRMSIDMVRMSSHVSKLWRVSMLGKPFLLSPLSLISNLSCDAIKAVNLYKVTLTWVPFIIYNIIYI